MEPGSRPRPALPAERYHVAPRIGPTPALAHGDPDTEGGWELLDADIDEKQAQAIAASSLAKSSASSGSLSSAPAQARVKKFLFDD